MPTPAPPQGSFESAAADKGNVLFNDKAKCATCHVPPLFSEPGWNLHTADDIGIDDFQAMPSPDERYRTASLRALYDRHLKLDLTDAERSDLIEYLKSI